MAKLIGLSGSLRRGSFNTALLRAVAELIPVGPELSLHTIRGGVSRPSRPAASLVIITELAGGIMIAVGWQTKLAAIAVGGFSVLAALFFHTAISDQNQMIHFIKNLAMAGGFLVLYANGPEQWSIDMKRLHRG